MRITVVMCVADMLQSVQIKLPHVSDVDIFCEAIFLSDRSVPSSCSNATDAMESAGTSCYLWWRNVGAHDWVPQCCAEDRHSLNIAKLGILHWHQRYGSCCQQMDFEKGCHRHENIMQYSG